MASTLTFFSANDVRSTLSMKEAIQAMKSAFVQLSGKQAIVPLRSQIALPESTNSALFMPVYLPDSKKIALKTVTIFPESKENYLPTIQALVTVFDAQNGKPLALLDGSALTAIRTGAASGLATDLLARTDSRILTVFGAGVQGRLQIEAVLTVRSIKKVIIVDLDEQRARALADDTAQQFNVEIVASVNAGDVREADVICTATASRKPVFSDMDLKNGVHINAIGAFQPDMREIPAQTMQRALLVVDERQACLSEAGDLIHPIEEGLFGMEHIYAEIGAIAAGKVKGRSNDTQITLFKSVGNAVQDLAAAEIVLKNGLKMKLGQTVQL